MSDRFFVPHPIGSRCVELHGPEARHLAVVMRGRPGQSVTLFDGSGSEFPARVVSVRRDHVQLEVLGRRNASRELPGRLVLASALPKGDRSRQLVEKAVELGVHCFVPLLTQRSVVRPGQIRLDRLSRVVVEASKQCGRNSLMQILPCADWPAFVRGQPASVVRLIAHREAPLLDLGSPHGPGLPDPSPQIAVAVGPEGGFTDGELQLAETAGWAPYSLGPRILRIETAAIVICSLAAGWFMHSTGPKPSSDR